MCVSVCLCLCVSVCVSLSVCVWSCYIISHTKHTHTHTLRTYMEALACDGVDFAVVCQNDTAADLHHIGVQHLWHFDLQVKDLWTRLVANVKQVPQALNLSERKRERESVCLPACLPVGLSVRF